jgi:ferritin-like metal-binding protein YciE
MKLDSLETLLVEELRDLYNAERQILKALPKMAKDRFLSKATKEFPGTSATNASPDGAS